MTSVQENGSIQFRFYRPGASEVKVVGTFNKWDKDALAMRPLGNGWWAGQATLQPGEYQFRYVADGHWYTDFAAHGVANTRHGWNAVLIVPQRTMRLFPTLARETEPRDQADRPKLSPPEHTPVGPDWTGDVHCAA